MVGAVNGEADDDTGQSQGEEDAKRQRARSKLAASVRRLNASPKLLTAAKLAREVLPGDSRFGDPLSTAGEEQPQVVGKRLAALTAERPGVVREAGLSALQVWQSLSEASGRGHGSEELAIVFTDLVGFSDWALHAGDEAVLELLRDVGQAMEPPVLARDGEVVKRLGDGMMATFASPRDAFDAVVDAHERIQDVEVDGHRPRFRAGLHVGKPRKIGGDYLGVDVNIAARVAEQAASDELLLSDRAYALLEQTGVEARKKRRFKVKGVPADMTAYKVALLA